MEGERDQSFLWKDRVYAPFHTFRISCGLFLPATPELVESYLEVPDGSILGIWDICVGDARLVRKTLHAARAYGDSMIGSNVRHGDIVIFQQWEFDYVENGQTVVIEKMADEEGYGSWALKKIIIERSALPFERESQTVDWDLPIITLRSSNPRFKARHLDPCGQYRICGKFLRRVKKGEETFIDVDTVRRIMAGEE